MRPRQSQQGSIYLPTAQRAMTLLRNVKYEQEGGKVLKEGERKAEDI
jgi:hypothetical protein